MIEVTVVNVDGFILRADRLDCWQCMLVWCELVAAKMKEMEPELIQCYNDMLTFGTGYLQVAA